MEGRNDKGREEGMNEGKEGKKERREEGEEPMTATDAGKTN